MNAILKEYMLSSIEFNICNHPTWLGNISGLKAEKLLRGKKTPYLYVLRAGENDLDYYVTFLLPDLTVKHQPFTITLALEGWCYENGAASGPYRDATIDNVLHQIMHCEEEECVPLINFGSACT